MATLTTGTPHTNGVTDKTKLRRFTVTFSEEIFQVLEVLANSRGKTMADVLRDAITLEKWVQDATAAGGKILLQNDEQIREVVIR